MGDSLHITRFCHGKVPHFQVLHKRSADRDHAPTREKNSVMTPIRSPKPRP